MAFFKTKQEKEIMAQMARDEQLEVFNDQIKTLQTKREEYARIAAEAEINGDTGTYEVACNALIELNDVISSLMQTKANFDIINVSNSIAVSMATAIKPTCPIYVKFRKRMRKSQNICVLSRFRKRLWQVRCVLLTPRTRQEVKPKWMPSAR